ncbi:hypothetical protein [Haloarchaeobius sp. FL176]|uniref:hypothetical protein n=1 Tax=Haloarchaeobius sp. FL176 TaxID=2967129 RepID=UPI002148FDF2|nr:hypothetical protein [Haloarchaeobius sp. FL176]
MDGDEDGETRRAAATLTQLKRMFRRPIGNLGGEDGAEGQVDDEELDELEEELSAEREQ